MSDEAKPIPSILHLLRLTLEAETPLAIGSGTDEEIPDPAADAPQGEPAPLVGQIVRDANGLPAIPGPSLQGVLRRLFPAKDKAEICELFGWAMGDDGAAGRLIIGWAGVHASDDVAVMGLRPRPETDDLLQHLQARDPMVRDHVALSHRHVTDGHKKFAQIAAPRGTRFSFEIAYWGRRGEEATDKKRLTKVVALITHPAFRLGGSSARGYGKVRLVRASYQAPGLTDPAAVRKLRRQPPSVGLKEALALDALESFQDAVVTATVTLRPINPWRVGGGRGCPLTNKIPQGPQAYGVFPFSRDRRDIGAMDEREEGPKDIAVIFREPAVGWIDDKGRWYAPGPGSAREFRIPGSAIRGPLAHRMLFHANLRAGAKIDVEEWLKLDGQARADRLESLLAREAAVEELLGRDDIQDADAQAGRLIVADGRVVDPHAVMAIDHNSIDRFTGGVSGSSLFSEEVLVEGKIQFSLIIKPRFPATDDRSAKPPPWQAETINPFLDALLDLCHGRLALGARSLGYFELPKDEKGNPIKVAWTGEGKDIWENAWKERTSR